MGDLLETGKQRIPTALPWSVPRQVRRELKDPGRQVLGRVEPAQVAEHANEDLLHQLLRPLPVLATTGEKDEVGIDGAIMDRTDHGQAVINTITVDKWEAGADAVKNAGGQVLMEKTPVPGQGYFAYCKDTEGNVFGIFEGDPTAGQEVGAGAKAEQA